VSKNKDKKILVIKLKILYKKGKNNKNEKQNKVKKQKYLFGKSSGLLPLASNPDIGAYNWGFLSIPVSSQGW
jgi:hypothetical protein